jgi:phosphotransferase system IIA component
MMTKKSEQVFIQIGDERIELTGAELEAFETNRKAIRDNELLLEAEAEAKKQARIDAITKLGQASGLTTEEIESILNI